VRSPGDADGKTDLARPTDAGYRSLFQQPAAFVPVMDGGAGRQLWPTTLVLQI